MSELVKVAGVIIIIDGIVSVAYSEDQRPLSTAGRIVRVAIGLGLVAWG